MTKTRTWALAIATNILRILIAKAEANGIDRLTKPLKLRVHVVGDCATTPTARIVSRAMVDYGKRTGKPAYAYTHAWRTVSRSAWGKANVIASCETVSDAHQAMARGYAVSLIVPPHPTHKLYTRGDLTVIPCQAQFTVNGRRKTTCAACNVCMSTNKLLATRRVVGFEPDGYSAKRILPLLGA